MNILSSWNKKNKNAIIIKYSKNLQFFSTRKINSRKSWKQAFGRVTKLLPNFFFLFFLFSPKNTFVHSNRWGGRGLKTEKARGRMFIYIYTARLGLKYFRLINKRARKRGRCQRFVSEELSRHPDIIIRYFEKLRHIISGCRWDSFCNPSQMRGNTVRYPQTWCFMYKTTFAHRNPQQIAYEYFPNFKLMDSACFEIIKLWDHHWVFQ